MSGSNDLSFNKPEERPSAPVPTEEGFTFPHASRTYSDPEVISQMPEVYPRQQPPFPDPVEDDEALPPKFAMEDVPEDADEEDIAAIEARNAEGLQNYQNQSRVVRQRNKDRKTRRTDRPAALRAWHVWMTAYENAEDARMRSWFEEARRVAAEAEERRRQEEEKKREEEEQKKKEEEKRIRTEKEAEERKKKEEEIWSRAAKRREEEQQQRQEEYRAPPTAEEIQQRADKARATAQAKRRAEAASKSKASSSRAMEDNASEAGTSKGKGKRRAAEAEDDDVQIVDPPPAPKKRRTGGKASEKTAFEKALENRPEVVFDSDDSEMSVDWNDHKYKRVASGKGCSGCRGRKETCYAPNDKAVKDRVTGCVGCHLQKSKCSFGVKVAPKSAATVPDSNPGSQAGENPASPEVKKKRTRRPKRPDPAEEGTDQYALGVSFGSLAGRIEKLEEQNTRLLRSNQELLDSNLRLEALVLQLTNGVKAALGLRRQANGDFVPEGSAQEASGSGGRPEEDKEPEGEKDRAKETEDMDIDKDVEGGKDAAGAEE
ncbi:hypothetical protein VNI00_015569 [Paramarasmius palmivorus]|uniref:Zn(2)-C6 fungal-type domain-containing protein n=1 Tax=Paramarasmius palmivorus TaxID=297713 RepID=A0AAW0BKU8_9AGAR